MHEYKVTIWVYVLHSEWATPVGSCDICEGILSFQDEFFPFPSAQLRDAVLDGLFLTFRFSGFISSKPTAIILIKGFNFRVRGSLLCLWLAFYCVEELTHCIVTESLKSLNPQNNWKPMYVVI